MPLETIECAVLFADIAGSTRLYEKFGDSVAQDMVSRCIATMMGICRDEGGAVVKTVGDGVMCRFPSADDAVRAACRINEHLDRNAINERATLMVRIGFHFGQAIVDGNDLYGDAVNLAARMSTIARARQIITTADTVERLSPGLVTARFYDQTTVKGKQQEIAIYEVLWEQEDVTRIMLAKTVTKQLAATELKLQYEASQLVVPPKAAVTHIGRGRQCDLVVESKLASRIHARIEYSRGKFVLIDQSTNGTFIKTDDGKEVYLRREDLPLWGHGWISLGKAIEEDTTHLIEFECQ